MIRGHAKFNGLALGEGSFSFMSTTVSLTAKAAFTDSTTGKTHGWTNMTTGWSKETMQKLNELRECVERDLASVHFVGDEDAVVPATRTNPPADAPQGLGEHLQADEFPQL